MLSRFKKIIFVGSLISFLPMVFVIAQTSSDVNSLIERANEVINNIYKLQSQLGEEPGARGISLDSAGVEVILTRKLKSGDRDATTDGEVSKLQGFLYDQYYYDGQITGTFSPATKQAVIDLQNENKQYLGVAKGNGVVTAATRELIRRISAGEDLDASIADFTDEAVVPDISPSTTPASASKPKIVRFIRLVTGGKATGNMLKPLEVYFVAFGGGTTGYLWKLTGTLPQGLRSKVTGEQLTIDGTPLETGYFPLKIKVTDNGSGSSASSSVTLIVGPEIVQPVTVRSPGARSEWLRGSYETIIWSGPAGANYEIRLNYYAVTCPSGVCRGLTPISRAIINAGVQGSSYFWLVGEKAGGPEMTGNYTYTVSVCDKRTGACGESGGFQLVEKSTDLKFRLDTDRYVYRAGVPISATFIVANRSDLRKTMNFTDACQVRFRLIRPVTGLAVYDSRSLEMCAVGETQVVLGPFEEQSWTGNIETANLPAGIYQVRADLGAGRQALTKITIE